jgi:cellobiose-specific phosphotransferase system component IIC
MAYWFKPKTKGYGNVPATWQGWMLTIGFTMFVFAMVLATYVEWVSKLWTVAIVLAVTAVYLPFIKAKTDGEWRWR